MNSEMISERNIGILVEGPNDKSVLEWALTKSGHIVKDPEGNVLRWRAKKFGHKKEDENKNKMVIRKGMGATLLDRKYVENTVRMLKKEHNCKEFIILYDTDERTKEEKEEFVKKKLGSIVQEYKLNLRFAIPCIESWVLGCFEGIDPERFRDSREAKNEFHKHSKNETISLIAQKNEIRHFEKSGSFKEFESTIEKLAKS